MGGNGSILWQCSYITNEVISYCLKVEFDKLKMDTELLDNSNTYTTKEGELLSQENGQKE